MVNLPYLPTVGWSFVLAKLNSTIFHKNYTNEWKWYPWWLEKYIQTSVNSLIYFPCLESSFPSHHGNSYSPNEILFWLSGFEPNLGLSEPLFLAEPNFLSPTELRRFNQGQQNNFGSLIPNPAPVFVLDIRISRKMTSKLPKIRIFDPFGGPALPIWGGGRIFLMHEIHCKTSNLNDTWDIITECMANHAKTEKKRMSFFSKYWCPVQKLMPDSESAAPN